MLLNPPGKHYITDFYKPFHPSLLVANDASRSTDAEPSDALVSSHAIMFHHVTSDERTGSSQSSCKRTRNGLIDEGYNEADLCCNIIG